MSTDSVNVTVSLGNETTKEFDDIYLEYENLADGLVVQAVEQNSTTVKCKC